MTRDALTVGRSTAPFVEAIVTKLRTLLGYVVDDSLWKDRKAHLQSISRTMGESLQEKGKNTAEAFAMIRRFVPKGRGRKGGLGEAPTSAEGRGRNLCHQF